MKRIISIALVIVMVMSMSVVSSFAGTSTGYSDVKDNAWYAEAVKTVSDAGLMTGVSADKFDPNGKVTYAQAAQIMYRYLMEHTVDGYDMVNAYYFNETGIDSKPMADALEYNQSYGLLCTPTFTDFKESDWFYEAYRFFLGHKNKYIPSVEFNYADPQHVSITGHPNASITRIDMAEFIGEVIDSCIRRYYDVIIDNYPDACYFNNKGEDKDIARPVFSDLSFAEDSEYVKNVNNKNHPGNALTTVDFKIMNGSNGNFRPNDSLTRAEMAQILTNAIKLQKLFDDAGGQDGPTTYYDKNLENIE